MELLAPTLGWEKSSEVVSVALSKRALPHGELTMDEAAALLDDLATRAGMVGIAARYAATRLQSQRGAPVSMGRPSASERPPPPSGNTPSSSRARPVSLDMREIVDLFASAMGRDKSHEVVASAAKRLGLPSDRLDKAQALNLVDQLAREPGVVGLCARFAKARLILRFAA